MQIGIVAKKIGLKSFSICEKDLLGGGLENLRDYLSESGWSLVLRRDVSSKHLHGKRVFRPSGIERDSFDPTTV
jgi:hypothetical protein